MCWGLLGLFRKKTTTQFVIFDKTHSNLLQFRIADFSKSFHFWLVVFSQHEIILSPFFRMTALARTHQGFFDESFLGGTCERGQKVGDIFFVGCYFCLGRLIIIWVFPKIMVPPNHQF